MEAAPSQFIATSVHKELKKKLAFLSIFSSSLYTAFAVYTPLSLLRTFFSFSFPLFPSFTLASFFATQAIYLLSTLSLFRSPPKYTSASKIIGSPTKVFDYKEKKNVIGEVGTNSVP